MEGYPGIPTGLLAAPLTLMLHSRVVGVERVKLFQNAPRLIQ